MTEIINSCDIRKIVGENIRRAREDAGLSRETLCNLLSLSPLAPPAYSSPEDGKSLEVGTLKQWEVGKNAVNTIWYPALCSVLHCDAGYLLGEYSQRNRETADVCRVTGLSETAVNKLKNELANQDTIHPALNRGMVQPMEILSNLISDPEFWRVICNLHHCTNPVVVDLMEQYNSTYTPFREAPLSSSSEMVPFADLMQEMNLSSAAAHFVSAAKRAVGWDVTE